MQNFLIGLKDPNTDMILRLIPEHLLKELAQCNVHLQVNGHNQLN